MTGRMLAILVGCVLLAAGAQAQTYTRIHSFCALDDDCPDGRNPQYGLVADAAGNFYGTTPHGGAGNDTGVAFKLSPDGGGGWTYSVIYEFCSRRGCPDGSGPSGPLIIDSAGNLYGVTQSGGKFHNGVAFKLVPQVGLWQLIKMHSFCRQGACADGAFPAGGLSYLGQRDGLPYDGTSLLYGTTRQGSAFQHGVVYSLKPGPNYWQHKTLYSFCPEMGTCPFDGSDPVSGVIVDAFNLLYGTTPLGGSALSGTAFRLNRSNGHWEHHVLHSFCSARNCTDGSSPSALAQDAAGNLYGGTLNGPRTPFCVKNLCGTLFRMTPAGVLTTLYTFCSEAGCADGAGPGPVTILDNGDLVGLAGAGGSTAGGVSFGSGTLFRLSGATLDVLHTFCTSANCPDGSGPAGTVAVDGAGRLFGVTVNGGAQQRGAIWQYEP